MSLRERLRTELTTAIRSQTAVRRDALRMVLAGVERVEKDSRHELSDEEMLAVLARELRTRRESVETFRAGGRDDLAAREEAAIAVIAELMPPPLDEAELRTLVDEAIATTGASSARDMGKVMGWLGPRTRGRAEGGHVSQLVRETLVARAGGS